MEATFEPSKEVGPLEADEEVDTTLPAPAELEDVDEVDEEEDPLELPELPELPDVPELPEFD